MVGCFLVLAKGRVTIGTVDCQIKLSIGGIRISRGDTLRVLCLNLFYWTLHVNDCINTPSKKLTSFTMTLASDYS